MDRARSRIRSGGRHGLVSALVAAAVAMAFAGAAFGLQAFTLPRPTKGQLIAARSMRWLTHEHATESWNAGSAGAATVCVDALVRLERPRSTLRGSLLVTRRGLLVDTRAARFRVGRFLRRLPGATASIAAVRAGCPHALERSLGRFLDDRSRVTAARKDEAGRTVLLLELIRPGHRLSLLLEPRTFAPFAVRVGGRTARWRYLSPAEPADLTRRSLRMPRSLRAIVKLRL